MTIRYTSLCLLLCALGAAPLAAQPAVGTCAPAKAQAHLEANQVRARIFNNGGLFWRGDPNLYEVPRGSGINSIFAASLWLGGQVNGQTRLAATTYGPYEFWPGPLDDSGTPPQDCSAFDRLYRINRAMLDQYEGSGIAAADLADWPTGLGAPTERPDGNGVFERVDVSDLTHSQRIARKIDLEAGERPQFSGDEMVWWIMNDLGSTHGNTGYKPLGVEVHGTAFAFSYPGPLGLTTFYRYRIENKTSAPIDSFYAGFYTDVDLGTFDDDYVGADTTLDMGFVYNASTTDGQYGIPPSLGVTYLQGVNVDGTQNDTVWVDGAPQPGRRALGMTAFLEYNSCYGSYDGDPSRGADFYNNLKGRWHDGKLIAEGRWPRNQSAPDSALTTFMYAGDPVEGAFWSEVNLDREGQINCFGDRRITMSSGPVTLAPGDVQEVVIAIVWARGADRFDSITRLRASVREVKAFGLDLDPPPPPPLTEIAHLVTPLDGATLPKAAIRLTWQRPANSVVEQVRLATDAAFTEGLRVFNGDVVQSAEAGVEVDTLAPGTYYWQVRGTASVEEGPWSDVQSFTIEDVTLTPIDPGYANFLTVRNADGPIEPPEYAAFAFNSSGFPHPTTAAQPDGTRQQSASAGLSASQGWGFATFGTRATFAEFVDRTTRDGANLTEIGINDYELRFVGQSIGWRRFEVGPLTMTVPFEIWDIGQTPGDPSDDVRLIPVICEHACGAGNRETTSTGENAFVGRFDVGRDSPVPGGSDDPYTDAVYWYRPVDNSPGEAGYNAYVAGITGATPNMDAVGAEVIARTVLMGWNMGTDPGPYTQALPEQGTIFRIVTSKQLAIDAPLIAAPVDGVELGPDSRLYWSQPDGTGGAEVQIARDAAFTDIVATVEALEQGSLSVRNFPTATYSGTYYWRVRANGLMSVSPWSAARSFVLNATVVASEVDEVLPTVLAIDGVWPNPASERSTLRYGVPVAGSVRVVLYDVLGREVQRVSNGEQPAGWHEVQVDASSLASGLYVVRVSANGRSVTLPLVVAR